MSVFDLLYQRYSAKLLPLKAKMNPGARYQSEEALRVLLEEILEQPEYSRYGYTQGVLLQNLLKDTEQLRRDAIKDSILKKYRLPLLRLATNGSREREKIEDMLKKQRDGGGEISEIPK